MEEGQEDTKEEEAEQQVGPRRLGGCGWRQVAEDRTRTHHGFIILNKCYYQTEL